MRLFVSIGMVVLMLAMLTGCATTYGPKESMGGYSEKEIDPTMVEVTFEGNQYNKAEQIRTYLTYRCAELTLEKGFSYFLIMEDKSYEQSGEKEFAESDLTIETRTSMSGGVNNRVSSNFGAQETGKNIVGVFVIKMLLNPDPVNISATMDAQAFIDNYGDVIKKR